MRGLGTFLAGVCFAAYVLVWSAPVLVALSLLGGLGGRFNLFEAVSGESVFGVRERDGQLQARMVNVNFHIAMVPIADEPRPRRLLLRLETVDVDVFDASRGEGQVRLDAWAMDGGRDMLRTPLYTVVAAGDDAGIEDDSLLVVSRGARRTAYALVSGRWLYEADGAVATFALEGVRRLVAVAAAYEEMIRRFGFWRDMDRAHPHGERHPRSGTGGNSSGSGPARDVAVGEIGPGAHGARSDRGADLLPPYSGAIGEGCFDTPNGKLRPS